MKKKINDKYDAKKSHIHVKSERYEKKIANKRFVDDPKNEKKLADRYHKDLGKIDNVEKQRKNALNRAEYKIGNRSYKETKGALYEDTKRYKKYDKLSSKYDKKASIASDRFNEALLNGSTSSIHKTMKKTLVTSSQKAYYNDMRQRYANNLINDTKKLKRYSILLGKENTYGTTTINNKQVYKSTFNDSRYTSAEKKRAKMRGSFNGYTNRKVPINGTPYKARVKTPTYKQYGYIPGPLPMFFVRKSGNTR